MDEITLNLSAAEVNFILQVLGAVPTARTIQDNMLSLMPKILQQANQRTLSPPPEEG